MPQRFLVATACAFLMLAGPMRADEPLRSGLKLGRPMTAVASPRNG